jgi:bacillolysin
MSQLERLNYHVDRDGERPEPPRTTVRGIGPKRGTQGARGGFETDEAAARFYLDGLIEDTGPAGVRGIQAPAGAGDLKHVATYRSGAGEPRLVRFQQTDGDVPIYGAEMVVELDPQRGLISASGQMGHPSDVASEASLTAEEALQSIETAAGRPVDRTDIPEPQLVYFKDANEERADREWHLAWYFREVPAAPAADVAEDAQKAPRSFRGPSLRASLQETDYVVDANDGDILHHFQSTPSLVEPVYCTGDDEDGSSQTFFGNLIPNGFEMRDGTRHLVTFDFDYGDLAASRALPAAPVSGSTSGWGTTARAAVSAHFNAGRVHDFYMRVLQRNGIDGQGMDLISIVKCRYVDPTYAEPYPSWVNAEWYKGKMWYGQVVSGGPAPVSLSRELDIIAHELTHGVIETTANLEYRAQPGALNESFADAFGIIIANWYRAPAPNDPATWTWLIGDGFASGGGPLRDMQNPANYSQPDHMTKYQNVGYDSGGVHINSGIPNKAVYNLLTARDAGGYVFTPEQVALLLYRGLLRLTKQSNFADARDAVVAATSTLFAGNAQLQAAKVGAVEQAYAAVGI